MEQLLFGSVRTGRPLLVCSALEVDVRLALEAQAKARQFLGDCAEEVPEDGLAAPLPFAPDLPYRVVRRLRQGWEACPPELASRLTASLPHWLAPRTGGDLLSTLPASTAAQTHAVAAFLLPPSEAGRAQDDSSAAAHYFYLVGGVSGQEAEGGVEWLLVGPEHKRAAAQLWRGGGGGGGGGGEGGGHEGGGAGGGGGGGEGGAGGSDERGGGEVRWPSEAAAQQGWPFPVHCARQRPGALLPRASTLQPCNPRLSGR